MKRQTVTKGRYREQEQKAGGRETGRRRGRKQRRFFLTLETCGRTTLSFISITASPNLVGCKPLTWVRALASSCCSSTLMTQSSTYLWSDSISSSVIPSLKDINHSSIVLVGSVG